MFSSEEFTGWSKSHVMYLHVTTRIENHPRDTMLRDVGFTSFPSFGIMDASGKLVARHAGERTLAGFDTTTKKAAAYVELRKKADAGDAAAKQHVFVQNLGLGLYTFSRGALAFAVQRKGMSKGLRKRARQGLNDLQYAELTGELRKQIQELGRQEYSRRYTELNVQFFRANKIPSGYRGNGVLSSVMRHAKAGNDATLFGEAFEAYKVRVGSESRYARAIEMYARQLEELRN